MASHTESGITLKSEILFDIENCREYKKLTGSGCSLIIENEKIGLGFKTCDRVIIEKDFIFFIELKDFTEVIFSNFVLNKWILNIFKKSLDCLMLFLSLKNNFNNSLNLEKCFDNQFSQILNCKILIIIGDANARDKGHYLTAIRKPIIDLLKPYFSLFNFPENIFWIGTYEVAKEKYTFVV